MYRTLAPPRDAHRVPRGGGGPALIAVAHGSRDPRSASTMAAVVAEVAAARPDLTVRLAFLDLCAPSVDQVAGELAALGHTDVVVVPLLLGSAFHARVDLPALLTDAGRRHRRLRLTQTDVLGPDPLLIGALSDRIIEAAASMAGPNRADHHPGELGIAVAAVGSRAAPANRRTAAVAHRLSASTGIRTEICFATAEPGITAAVRRLRARGAAHIVVAPWFLAPGLLTDRLLTEAPDLVHAGVIGTHRALVEVIWARYDTAITADLELSA